jgi:hypothetical protein
MHEILLERRALDVRLVFVHICRGNTDRRANSVVGAVPYLIAL